MTPAPHYYRWRPHPWHGIEVGPEPPNIVYAYIEMTPFDSVKYEVDKLTGYLHVDRPQLTSSTPPTLYGFIPRTYCAKRVGALAPHAKNGDGDPMDICVISERPVNRAEVVLTTHVIGGFQMIDGGLADDKIIAVLQKDAIWGNITDLSDLPNALVERLRHYFLTYKLIPGSQAQVHIDEIYGRDHALKVIQAAIEDYQEAFGQMDQDNKDLE
jgi:inorganic pyrophosphatase